VYPNAQKTVPRGYRGFAWPKVHYQGSPKHFSCCFMTEFSDVRQEVYSDAACPDDAHRREGLYACLGAIWGPGSSPRLGLGKVRGLEGGEAEGGLIYRAWAMAFRSYRASSTSFSVCRSFLSWRLAARFCSGSNSLSKPPGSASTARIKRVPPGTS
jgi:hypothetical protein